MRLTCQPTRGSSMSPCRPTAGERPSTRGSDDAPRLGCRPNLTFCVQDKWTTFSVAAEPFRWLPDFCGGCQPLGGCCPWRWLPTLGGCRPSYAHLQRQHTGSWLGGCRPSVAADRAVGPTFRDLPTSHRRYPRDGSALQWGQPSGPAAVYRRPSAVRRELGACADILGAGLWWPPTFRWLLPFLCTPPAPTYWELDPVPTYWELDSLRQHTRSGHGSSADILGAGCRRQHTGS